MKNLFLIVILIFSSTFVIFANDEYHIYYESIRQLVPDTYNVPIINTLDFDNDGLNEVWAIGNTSDGGFSRFFIYKDKNPGLGYYWSSPEMKGTSYRWGFFRSDETRYIWIETYIEELDLYQMWIYKWLNESTYMINPTNITDKNYLVSKLSFACSYNRNDGEYEFSAYFPDEGGTLIKSYVVRHDTVVFKGETYSERVKLNNSLLQSGTTAEKSESLVDKWALMNFPSYDSIDVVKICYEKQLYLASIRQVNNEETILAILEEKDDKVLLWYYLNQEYALFELQGRRTQDLNNDGFKEVFFYDRTSRYQVQLYILSILPNHPRLITPVDVNGVSTVVVTGPIEFEDYNKNGHLDMLIDSVGYISLWLWNPIADQFEYYGHVY